MPHATPLRILTSPPEDVGVFDLRLETTGDPLPSRLHLAEGDAAVLWVFGSGGGLGGPAGGVYDRLARTLRPEGLTSLELDYRRPGHLEPCVADVLAGIAWMHAVGKRRIVLVGHSFGGAVAIQSGAVSPAVIAVAALSSQTFGALDAVADVSPRPLLFIHGEADDVLPARCSRELHRLAGHPKRLILYPNCGHGLDECRDALDRDLLEWMREVV